MQKIIEKLANRKPDIMGKCDLFTSAVLLPLLEKQGKIHVLFEVRAEHLKIQPGEICFPGGKVEEGEHVQSAAIREAIEELGIKKEDIRIIGPLDILLTLQGRLVYSYVGQILTEDLKPNPKEVAEIFTVPVEFFLKNPPTVFYTEVATRYPSDFPFEKVPPAYKRGWQTRWFTRGYFFEYDKYFIWGMTAKILYNFFKLCWP